MWELPLQLNISEAVDLKHALNFCIKNKEAFKAATEAVVNVTPDSEKQWKIASLEQNIRSLSEIRNKVTELLKQY